MGSVRKSFLFSAFQRYMTLAITLLTTAITARILTPDEIGIFVVGSAVVLVADALRDFGASAYVVQEKQLSRDRIRTTFTIMIGIALLVVAILNVMAGPFARFYADPRLEMVVRVASLSIITSAIGGLPVSLLKRDLAFRPLAVIGLVTVTSNCLAVTLLTFAGWGYLSLAIAWVASSIVGTGTAILCQSEVWIYVPGISQWRRVFAFSSYATAGTILNILYQSVPQLCFGRLLGFDGVAIFTRAMTVSQLPERALVGAFQPVVFPAFAAEVRNGGDLRAAYLRGLELLSSVQWPALLCIAILAEPVIWILLGPQWGRAAPLVRIMAIALLFMVPAPLSYPVLVSLGRIKDTLLVSLATLPISAVVMVGAATVSPAMAAASMLITCPLQVLVTVNLIRRRIGLTWGELAGSLRASALAAAAAAALPLVIVATVGTSLSILSLVLVLCGSLVAWVTALRLTSHPLLAELRTFTEQAFSVIRSFPVSRSQA